MALSPALPLPRATYRVQLHRDFTFDDAAAIVGYLANLGISHLYCSPCLQAGKGSTHGYDVVSHSAINEELGGAAGHERLSRALAEQRLGRVVDIVPNHMSIAGPENIWWHDVLENGPASQYASYFDVDWQPPDARLRNTILLPVLADHYGRVLEAGEFSLRRDAGSMSLHYGDHRFPLSPRSVETVLHRAAERCPEDRLAFLADSFARLPHAAATDRRSARLRRRDKEVLREMLEQLCREQPPVAEAIDVALREIAADHEALHALLERQNYRLAYWRTAGQDLDYRRFFDVSSLASLRVEDEQVFQDTHALVLGWVRAGLVDGLRVDHPDGLMDPKAYFDRLRQEAPRAWITAEKILQVDEALPADWPVAGTTGYDFLNLVNGLFVDPAGEESLTAFYGEFTGEPTDFAAVMHDKKQLVLRQLFAAEVNRLANLLAQICEADRRHRDYPRRDLVLAIREVLSCMSVYRTYVQAASGETSVADERRIDEAIEAAKAHQPDVDAGLFDFLRAILLLRVGGDGAAEFVARFQQTSGPVMAKGVEDTAFYCFNRLVSLNEVGGDPARFAVSTDQFHKACQRALADWPAAMLASTTHDTKRNEDVRARINLLSEIPALWREVVLDWSRHNAPQRRGDWPDRNMEQLLYQTLVGAWPIDAERLNAYALKAAREAKQHTTWMSPAADYEDALQSFVSGILADPEFLRRLESFVQPLIAPGRVNALAQTLLKLTAPGVPDVFQGTEIWNLSLVDPDNRRPVDYASRRSLLAELETLTPEQIVARGDEGLTKLWTIRQTLHLRARCPDLFSPEASYEPLAAVGSRCIHVVAFARAGRAISVVPRWPLKLSGEWQDTTLGLPPGNWRDEFTGRSLSGSAEVSSLLAEFPIALLFLK